MTDAVAPPGPPNIIPATDRPAVIVCGLGRLGLRCVELLRETGAAVTVITDPRTRADRQRRAADLGATVALGDYRFPDVREAAGVDRASAVLLVSSFDAANLEAALDLRRDYPDLRIVMRFESGKLAARLQADFGIDAVLSPPDLAAPWFAAAALAPPPSERPQATLPAGVPRPRRPRLTSPLDGRHDARFVVGLVGVLFVAAVALFHRYLGLSFVDSVYFAAAIVSTVGFGDFNLQHAPALVKLFGVALMFSGVTLIAVLSSLLTNFLISGAAIQYRAEQIARRLRGHVIVCGLGSVGSAVVALLRERGVPLVAVDSTPDERSVQGFASRPPILIGDATSAETLLRAGIDHARAVLVVTSDDAVNLEIGLTAQSLVEERRPDSPLRLVVRCFDPDLAKRIHALSAAYTLLSSAEIAAPVFVSDAIGATPPPEGLAAPQVEVS